MKLYVDCFNRRDWEGVRELISADARLTVADAFAGKLADAPYFSNYERFAIPWKLAMGEVDGEPVVIILQRGADTWRPHSVVRLTVVGQHIGGIVDYVHCPSVISMAESATVVAHPQLGSFSRSWRRDLCFDGRPYNIARATVCFRPWSSDLPSVCRNE